MPGPASDPVLAHDVADGVRVLELNRPDALNALSPDLVIALHRELDRLEHDESVRVVVLTGRGRGFCAGVDLNGGPFPVDETASPQRRWFVVQKWFSGLVLKLRRIPSPWSRR